MFRAGPTGKESTGPGQLSEKIIEFNTSIWSICRTWLGKVCRKSIFNDFWPAHQSNWQSISTFLIWLCANVLNCNVRELFLLFWPGPARRKSTGPGPEKIGLTGHFWRNSRPCPWTSLVFTYCLQCTDANSHTITVWRANRLRACMSIWGHGVQVLTACRRTTLKKQSGTKFAMSSYIVECKAIVKEGRAESIVRCNDTVLG
jgi:hypothetical protein